MTLPFVQLSSPAAQAPLPKKRSEPAARAALGALSRKPPSGSLPVEVKVMNGGLITCTYDGPVSAGGGTVKLSCAADGTLRGMRGCPLVGHTPPRLTTPAPCWLKRLMIAPLAKPVPLTVTVVPSWVTPVIVGAPPREA